MMPESPRSQLPSAPEYWQALANRITDDARGPLAEYAAGPVVWYGVLARRAPWLVAASAAAMLVLWTWLPVFESSVTVQWIERSVEPDELAGTLVGGNAPPSVDALMVHFPPAFDEGGMP